MTPEILNAVKYMESRGWHCEMAGADPDSPVIALPDFILERYPWIPADVRTAMEEIHSLVHEETTWLLTAAEYADTVEGGFNWNAWEQLSIDSAEEEEDDEWIAEIKAFWDKHLPIATSVWDGYAYYALREDGSVVSGREPEFEETTEVAASYAEFLMHIAPVPPV
ncbi:SMI1/KNR4 family protein [Verrucomicrobia bacterium LW23]|nr:SMI1/KNR4 family protein [Verrucomicrobia bacterium LW23]